MVHRTKIKQYHSHMRTVKKKRLAVKELKPVVIRDVSNDNLHVSIDYNYLVYFDTRSEIYRVLQANMFDIKEFIRTSTSGKYNLVTTGKYNSVRLYLDHIKFELETDVLMLLLCHPLHIRKILKITSR